MPGITRSAGPAKLGSALWPLVGDGGGSHLCALRKQRPGSPSPLPPHLGYRLTSSGSTVRVPGSYDQGCYFPPGVDLRTRVVVENLLLRRSLLRGSPGSFGCWIVGARF